TKIITLHEAVFCRGPVTETDKGKMPPNCRQCGKGCDNVHATWFARGARYYGFAAMPICTDCCHKIEYWRERLAGEMDVSAYPGIQILPKPCKLLLDIERADLEADRAESR